MSTSVESAEPLGSLGWLLGPLDPACAPEVLAQLRQPAARRALSSTRSIVLCGHRAAGKSSLLPRIARLAGRRGFDLDEELARAAGRDLAEWLRVDPEGFRCEERRVFAGLPRGAVVAVGGGFLALHPDLLAGHLAVEVPITFSTYRARLLHDGSRPRLRPWLSLEEELKTVWEERSERHRSASPMPLGVLLRDLLGVTS